MLPWLLTTKNHALRAVAIAAVYVFACALIAQFLFPRNAGIVTIVLSLTGLLALGVIASRRRG
jgi:hypothetical protein